MDIETTEAIDGLRADIGRVETSLRREIKDSRDELRRHFDVVAESLRDDIRRVAEGLAVLTMKVDSLQR